jgi:hypothetical protein
VKKQFFSLFVGLMTFAVGAQGINEMIDYSTSELNGTARFKSLSGAFGALGGDLSAITINPAGSAIFNHSEVGITLSTSSLENTTSFFENSKLTDQNQFAFDQAGAVFVMKNFGKGNWKKISFGFNYQTQRNFKNNIHAGFVNNKNSIEDYFLDYAQGFNVADLGADNITSAYIDIGNSLGYNAQQAFLGFQSYLIDYGDLSNDGIDNPGYYSHLSHNGSVDQEIFLDTNGMSDQINFNIAAQFKDSFYIGMNLNFHSIDYREKSDFYEYGYTSDTAVREVRFYNELYTLGKGFSLQLGAIGKINNNIRLGLSYQSPTWYSLEDEISQYIVTYSGEEGGLDYYIDPNVIVVFDNAKLQTPSSLTASAAFVFGKKGLLSIDYINKNYRNTSLSPNNQFSIANALANETFTNTNAIRIGSEYRINRLSLRGGYRFEENPYKVAGLGSETKGFSLGMGYDFGGTLLSMSYSKTSSGRGRQLYTTGLTDQFNISQDLSNVSLSLVFKL